MSYYLTKLITQLIYPLNVGLIGIAVGYTWMRRLRRKPAPVTSGKRKWLGLVPEAATVCLGTSIMWLWLWSMPAFARMLVGHLERLYPSVAVESLPSAEAIVVLGGCISPVTPPLLYADLNDASSRLWHAARLYRAGKAPLVIVTSQTNEAAAMKGFLVEFGIPESAIVRGMRSRTTYENAVCTWELVQGLLARSQVAGGGAVASNRCPSVTGPRPRILLVTSAMHMRRAMLNFERAGFDAIPAATAYKVVNDPNPMPGFRWLPDAGALGDSTAAFKEHVGYWVYRVRGRSPAQASPSIPQASSLTPAGLDLAERATYERLGLWFEHLKRRSG